MSDNYFNHQQLVKRTEVLASRTFPKDFRTFGRHVGLFYKKRTGGGMIDYTPIQINRKGMADAWGVFTLDIFGIKIPIHIEMEYKTGAGALTDEQKVWRCYCETFGIPWFEIRDENKFINDLKWTMANLRNELIEKVRQNANTIRA